MGGAMRVQKAAVQIPEDVTVEILKMLPVKSLLRFRCTCKTWYSIISDPEFCNKLHQRRALVLIGRIPVTIESLLIDEKNPILTTPLSLPWEQPESKGWSRSKFLGSCNGLVYVDYGSADRRGLILWNPSTRKFKELPTTTPVRNWFNKNTYAGFGYEESTGDYKFVWMVCKPHRSLRETVFDVFSLQSNTWSRCQYHYHPSSYIILSGPSRFSPKLTGVLSNGAIHWAVHCEYYSPDSLRIIALDLASDNYRLLKTPEECGNAMSSNVVSLSGCLWLCNRSATDGFRIDMWVMKEYGVESSWSKLISIPSSIWVRTLDPILLSNEEGKIVAMVKRFTRRNRYVCEIMRFQVGKEAEANAETLLCDDVSTIVFEDEDVLHMEETLVSIS